MILQRTFIRFSQVVLILAGLVLLMVHPSFFPSYYSPRFMGVMAFVYAFLIQPLGIYVASIIFMAWFMKALGKYSWLKVALISIGLNVVFFAVFEFWFKVPLPKGPLEAALGLN